MRRRTKLADANEYINFGVLYYRISTSSDLLYIPLSTSEGKHYFFFAPFLSHPVDTTMAGTQKKKGKSSL